jgi:hypothetical protein
VERQRIFISYRRADSAGHAGRLEADLSRMLRTPVFMDVSDIAPGADFTQALDRELQSCAAVLAVIGSRWREAFAAPRDGPDYVRLELRQALGHAGVAVIPVLVQGAVLPSEAELPEDVKALARRQAVGLRDERWDDDVRYLARGLRSSLGLGRRPPWLVPTAVAALALLAGTVWLRRPEKPSAFDRGRAYTVAIEAARRAVTSCAAPKGAPGECPVLLEFVPSGKVRTAYYDTGYCELKGSAFGDCVLKKLESVRIPPFDDAPSVQLELGIAVAASGDVTVAVGE